MACDKTVGLAGLLVVTDAASQAGDRGSEARLRHPRFVSAGLGRHVADLIDLALFCRVIEPWAIHVAGPARSVRQCPLIGVDRKWQAQGQNDAIDPKATISKGTSAEFRFRLLEPRKTVGQIRRRLDPSSFDPRFRFGRPKAVL
jgi:hypothetical protein